MSNDGGTVVPAVGGPLAAPDATIGDGLDLIDVAQLGARWDMLLRYVDAGGERFDITVRCPDEAHVDSILREPPGFTFAGAHVEAPVAIPPAGPAELRHDVTELVADRLGDPAPWLADLGPDASMEQLLVAAGRPPTADLLDDALVTRVAELALTDGYWRDAVAALGPEGIVDWVLAVTRAEQLRADASAHGALDGDGFEDGITVEITSERVARGDFEGHVRMRVDPRVGPRRRDCYLTRGPLPTTFSAYVHGLQGAGAEAKAYFQNRTRYHPHSSNIAWQRLAVGRWERIRPINPVRHRKHRLDVRNMSFNGTFVYEVEIVGSYALHRNDVRL